MNKSWFFFIIDLKLFWRDNLTIILHGSPSWKFWIKIGLNRDHFITSESIVLRQNDSWYYFSSYYLGYVNFEENWLVSSNLANFWPSKNIGAIKLFLTFLEFKTCYEINFNLKLILKFLTSLVEPISVFLWVLKIYQLFC